MAEVNPELLSDVKNFLDITWGDEAVDNKISGLIQSGIVYLNSKYGEEADYSVPGIPRTLLLEYVRYARDYASDVFENNYMAMILGMQNERAVQKYVETAEQTAE